MALPEDELCEDTFGMARDALESIEKERAKLEKQQVELLAFDEKLRDYADRRVTLDLDDGVNINYGKFVDLLVEVAAVHGKKAGRA